MPDFRFIEQYADPAIPGNQIFVYAVGKDGRCAYTSICVAPGTPAEYVRGLADFRISRFIEHEF